MPRPEDLHIDVAESGFALDYGNGLKDYIGPLVAPVLNVTKQTGKYWIADRVNRLMDIQRAPRDEYKVVDWGYSTDDYQCKGYGAKALTDIESIKNADPMVDPEQDAIAAVVDEVMINAESRIASKLFSASVITQTSALTSTARWDSTAPDPWGNRVTANAAVRPATGKKVNTLVINDDVWENLRKITAVKNAIYGSTGPQGVPTTDQVAAVLGLKRIIVGAASYWNGTAFVDLWGKSALWAYYPDSVDENRGRIVVPMRTVVWNIDGVGRFQVSQPWEDRDHRSWARYVDDYTDELVVCASAAYLFTTVIS
jgi:hypothetical protein